MTLQKLNGLFGQTVVLILILFSSLANAQMPGAASAPPPAKPAGIAKPGAPGKAGDSKVTVTDKWFFVTPASKKQQSRKKTILMVVHSDQDFGFDVKFKTSKKSVNLKIKLSVPKQAANFPCLTCKPGEFKIVDDNTVTVNQNIDGTSGESYFFWGIGAEDPRGKYELSFWLDDKPVDAYKFEVK